MQLVLKLVLNSLHGKTAQRRGNKAGNLFNPIICAYITGYTRAQLYSFVRQNNLEQDVVAFATDSIMARRKIEGLNSKALGEFKYEKSGLVILLSNGIYSFDGEWKQRGIGSDKGIEISHKDTYIDKKGRLLLNLSVKRVTKFRTAWRQNRLGRA